MHGDDSTWIQTASGRAFYPLDPRPKDVCIEDIAHALSMSCRFNGHTRELYSVAQHCVLGALWMEGSREERLAFLLHDATEAYLPEVTRPVKSQLYVAYGGSFRDAEARLMDAILDGLGVSGYPACSTCEAKTHATDLRMLATERLQLMSAPPRPWKFTEGVEPFDRLIHPWQPWIAKQEYLRAYKELHV